MSLVYDGIGVFQLYSGRSLLSHSEDVLWTRCGAWRGEEPVAESDREMR